MAGEDMGLIRLGDWAEFVVDRGESSRQRVGQQALVSADREIAVIVHGESLPGAWDSWGRFCDSRVPGWRSVQRSCSNSTAGTSAGAHVS